MTTTDTTKPNASTTTGERPGRTKNKKPLGLLGVDAAACAACCAGPILGFLAAAGVLTVTGAALFGFLGLLVLVPVVGWYLRRLRQATACASPNETPIPVELRRRS